MSAGKQSQHLQTLAQSLVEGNRKNALSLIRKRLNEPFPSEYEMLVWKGWERALHRQESMSLIFQLLNGLSVKDAKAALKDIKRKKTEILIRDHTQTELSKQYLHNWALLLDFYSQLSSQ